jgi:hypothetical protein
MQTVRLMATAFLCSTRQELHQLQAVRTCCQGFWRLWPTNQPFHVTIAGSHDLELGRKTLAQLSALTTPGSSAAVPRYDKSAFGGLGDRATPERWPVVHGVHALALVAYGV